MADTLRSLLIAIYNDMESEKTGVFDYLESHWLVDPRFFHIDMATRAPFFLVYPVFETVSATTLQCNHAEKDGSIMISVFTEYPNDYEGMASNATSGVKGIMETAYDVETQYDRNNLGLSNMPRALILTSRSFQSIGNADLDIYFQAHLTFNYHYIDTRS